MSSTSRPAYRAPTARTAAKHESFEKALASLEKHARDSSKHGQHYLRHSKKNNFARLLGPLPSVVQFQGPCKRVI